ncbi:integrase core domain protein [Ceratobasidium sp. AG-Ba]|nr:integrase core domain protein [Ceratobasidium sp. AG-Ba]
MQNIGSKILYLRARILAHFLAKTPPSTQRGARAGSPADSTFLFEDEDPTYPVERSPHISSSTPPSFDSPVLGSPYSLVDEILSDIPQTLTPPPTVGRPRSESESTERAHNPPVLVKEWLGPPRTPSGSFVSGTSTGYAAPAPLPLPSTPFAQTGANSRARPPHLPATQTIPPAPAPSPTLAPAAPSAPTLQIALMPPATTQGATPEDLEKARARLDAKDHFFDGTEEEVAEEFWRDAFETIANAYSLSEPQKLSLWKERLVAGSEAHRWWRRMHGEGRIGSWPELVAELVAQWPPADTGAETTANLEKWYKGDIEDAKLGTIVKIGSKEEKYHVAWAKERLKLAGKVSMDQPTKAQTTYLRALTPLIRGLLPKTVSGYTTINELCKDVMAIDQERLENLVEERTARQELAEGLAEIQHRMGRMEMARQAQSYQNRATPRPAPQRTQVQFADMYNSFQTPRQSIVNTPLAKLATPTQPPSTPAPVNSRPPTLASPFGRRSNLPPTARGRGIKFEDTDDGRAAYAAALAALPPGDPPSSTPFPLTPGTWLQDSRVCTRCGKGNHLATMCHGGAALDSKEIRWRSAVKMELLGEDPRTPGRRDTFAVMVEDGIAPEEIIDSYESSALVFGDSEEGNGIQEAHEDAIPVFNRIDSFVCYSKPRDEVSEDEMQDRIINVLQILPNTNKPIAIYTKPFQRWITIEINAPGVEARGTVDAGSQANVMDAALWAANQVRLGPLLPTRTLLRVADGKASKCLGKWRGVIEMDRVGVRTEFEVFDSGGAFEVLLGKPWLTLVKAEQRFEDDSLKLDGLEYALPNGYPLLEQAPPVPRGEMTREETKMEEVAADCEDTKNGWAETGDGETLGLTDEVVREEEVFGEETEWKPVVRKSSRLQNRSAQAASLELRKNAFYVDEIQLEKMEELVGMKKGSVEERQKSPEQAFEQALQRAVRTKHRREKVEQEFSKGESKLEVLVTEVNHSAHLPTTPSERRSDPFAPSRVAIILNSVTIGPDLSDSERAAAKSLVAEFADIFARDLTEVLPVSTHSHKLNIPEGTLFRKRVPQRPLTQAQKAWLYPTLDQMEAAHIIKRVPNTFPAAVSPTNVVPKPGGSNEPSLEYIQALANKACVEAGLPAAFPNLTTPPEPPPTKEQKFRLVHNFGEVNNVTKIPPFPMGDLAAKQRAVAGSDASFAGAKVSIQGVQPDRRKIQAILEFPEPKSVLELMGFLGLTGSFREKIRDYARIAQPLTDRTRNIKMERRPDGKSKRGEYKRALENAPLELSEEAKRAIIELKLTLTTDPVLRAPVYDGRSFIVTTDGSNTGLEQCSRSGGRRRTHGQAAIGNVPTCLCLQTHFTCRGKYAPFLLEFAALKFALDSFEQIIMGQSIEIETDCKALADLLGNKKLSTTHERWRESIIAHRIVDVRHRPGAENPVCDALSRVWQYREDEHVQGREWSVEPEWEAHKGLLAEVSLLLEDDESRKVLERFEHDPYFGEIVQYLVLGGVAGDDLARSSVERAQKRAAHRAVGFEVAEGKLWRVAGRGRTVHPELSVFRGERFFWPNLRSDVTTAITSCPRCRNFGPKLMHALLAPITRAKPFDLLTGDYLSLPTGAGGFKTVLLITDVYSRFVFGFMSKDSGTGVFTVKCLDKIADHIMTPSSFMSDNGSHFDCREVDDWADRNGVGIIHPPPHTPSVNGLIENSNKILLGRLRTLCAEAIGESSGDPDRPPTPPPRSWPHFFQTAIRQMNDRVLSTLGYTPRELLTGVLSSDRKATVGAQIRQQYSANFGKLSLDQVDVNMALTYAIRSDAEEKALAHAREQKRRFDSKAKVFFGEAGDLVQRYNPRWDNTHSNERKLAPKWSGPLRIRERKNASYVLEDLEGELVSPGTHSRHLRPFHAKLQPGEYIQAAKAEEPVYRGEEGEDTEG